ncbi:MAG: hypothetical protein HYV26_22470, partial [Candidatus Hydrogenedentes bacterium]|nr:hypothetical protein [Candidatus Hydrogenedentota bacterium]
MVLKLIETCREVKYSAHNWPGRGSTIPATLGRGVSALLALAGVLAAGSMGCAHDTARYSPADVVSPPPAEAGIAPPPPINNTVAPVAAEGAAVPLSRDGAILTALLHNRSLEVAHIGPEIDATFIDEAHARFD